MEDYTAELFGQLMSNDEQTFINDEDKGKKEMYAVYQTALDCDQSLHLVRIVNATSKDDALKKMSMDFNFRMEFYPICNSFIHKLIKAVLVKEDKIITNSPHYNVDLSVIAIDDKLYKFGQRMFKAAEAFNAVMLDEHGIDFIRHRDRYDKIDYDEHMDDDDWLLFVTSTCQASLVGNEIIM
jgi:hypothetical protein